MAEIYVRNRDSRPEVVSSENPFPVYLQDTALQPGTVTVRQLLERNVDLTSWFTLERRVFTASDGDQNDTITGQTSFADTTPAITLRVPANTVVIPILVRLAQTGTVAGADISILMEIAGVDRYSSGGTTEAIKNKRVGGTGLYNSQCSVITGATITATSASLPLGYLPWQITVGPDVSPAEGISNEYIWTPTGPTFIEGPGSLNIWAHAGTTGPTLFWGLEWIEIPLERMGF